jgi:hypothetical protein
LNAGREKTTQDSREEIDSPPAKRRKQDRPKARRRKKTITKGDQHVTVKTSQAIRSGAGGNMTPKNSSEKEEVEKHPECPVLVEGAAPHNKHVTVDELLVGSFDEEDGKDYIDKGWYKKTLSLSIFLLRLNILYISGTPIGTGSKGAGD